MNIPKIKMLVLSLTGQCNFACKYCYAAEHDGSMLKVDDAIKAVNLAACFYEAHAKASAYKTGESAV